ncbi:hypothetical protein LSAT2_006000 [Lamellibrachia satsuma]|nr:hypothetical protein LSAT2_006000 [Lamellibrachia satsuma]
MGHCDFYYDGHKPCKGDASQEGPLWRGVAIKHRPRRLCPGQHTSPQSARVDWFNTQAEGLRRPTKTKRSLQSTGVYQAIRQYSACGKRRAVISFSGKIQVEWFKCTGNLHSAA